MDPNAPVDFKSMQEGIQNALLSTVKTTNRITTHDLAFQRTANPSTADLLDDKIEHVLSTSNDLLGSAAKACGVAAPKLEDAEDIDFNWRKIIDVVDSLLEKAATALDEYTGAVKRRDAPSAETTPKAKKHKGAGLDRNIRNANVPKPQLQFERPPDNFSTGPWRPILTRKPHAIVSLKKSLKLDQGSDPPAYAATISSSLARSLQGHPQEACKMTKKSKRKRKKIANIGPRMKHPYEPEILAMTYPESLFQHADPILYQPLDAAEATWVDTYDGVLDMLQELKEAKEIAIDLEHHDYRTYNGLVSLMQISTRDKDWIVDTLKPWRHQLEILNEVFADPTILKVFHGAYMDIQWLQRDLGLYINGLFDTFFPCELLGFPQRSLAYLLKRFVDFDADKKYQMADWRIRPLPREMFYYARSDTHYLLYVYDNLRNLLIERSDRSTPDTDLIGTSLQKSRELSLNRYSPGLFDLETGDGARGWYNYLLKFATSMSGEQFAVFRAVWKWRDDVARQEDESPSYVMPVAAVMQVAKVLPPDVKALHSLFDRGYSMAKTKLDDLLPVVQQAKAAGAKGPTLAEFLSQQRRRSDKTDESAPTPLRLDIDDPSMQVVTRTLAKTQLFGDVPLSSVWERPAGVAVAADDAEQLVMLPWQRFVQGARQAEASGSPAAAAERGATARAVVGESESDGGAKLDQSGSGEFTLRAGMKRKLAQASSSSASDTSSSEDSSSDEGAALESGPEPATSAAETAEADDEIMMEDENRRSKKRKGQPRPVKAAKKISGRERKKKDGREAKGKAPRPVEDETPFDYGQASSVLHAKKSAPAAAGGKKKFNPYAKLDVEGVKPARRQHLPNEGKSKTFTK